MRNIHMFTVEMTDEESALFERAFPNDSEDHFDARLRAVLLGMARSELRMLGERAARSRMKSYAKAEANGKYMPTPLEDYKF